MSWDVRPDVLMIRIEQDVADLRNNAAKYALRRLVQTTPVDTGYSRGNWVAVVASAKRASLFSRIKAGVISAYYTFKRTGDGSDINIRTPAQALSVETAKIDATKNDPWATISIVNITPYLPFVNNGTKYIKPRRFVEAAWNDVKAKFG